MKQEFQDYREVDEYTFFKWVEKVSGLSYRDREGREHFCLHKLEYNRVNI